MVFGIISSGRCMMGHVVQVNPGSAWLIVTAALDPIDFIALKRNS